VTTGFRSRRGVVTATFAAEEVQVLRGLVGELVELIRDDAPEPTTRPPEDTFAAIVGALGSTEPPEDDVLARLFPNAYADDEEAAGEFRRFTERGLRDGKVANARAVLDSLGDPAFSDQVTVSLDPGEAQAWMRTLTDVRLALGTRLGVEQDDEGFWEALPVDDPRGQVHGIYLWLGWLQESLVASLW
jgi:hypothetical protein